MVLFAIRCNSVVEHLPMVVAQWQNTCLIIPRSRVQAQPLRLALDNKSFTFDVVLGDAGAVPLLRALADPRGHALALAVQPADGILGAQGVLQPAH